MSDSLHTNDQPDDITKKYQTILQKYGYVVTSTSVHGKNQTRFLHFILEKDGLKYFCKANRPGLYDTHVNSSLVHKLTDQSPPNVQFLTPLKEIEVDDVIFHIYTYIDQKPVSNESAGFTDFLIDDADVESYLNGVIDAIQHISSRQFVTTNEHQRSVSTQQAVIRLLRSLPDDTPYAIEFLKYLLSRSDVDEFELAMDDIQPQNMFWLKQDKKLVVFDLDAISPQLRYFDHAKFAAQLWVVYDKPVLAKRFVEMTLGRLSATEKSDAYRYLRFNFTREALMHYAHFNDPESRQRSLDLMKWVRKGLLELINTH